MSEANRPLARNPRIDALKLFAIALVVFSHVMNRTEWTSIDDQIVYFIVKFNMPLFMFLSGYVLCGREGTSPLGFLKKKFQGLMVPRYFWILVYGLLAGMAATQVPARMLRATYDGSGRWFLYALFVFFVVFTAVRALPSSDWILALVALAATASSAVFEPTTTVLGIAYGSLFLYFASGYLVAKHRALLRPFRTQVLVSSAVLFVVLAAAALPVDGTLPGWYPEVRAWLHGRGLPGSYPLVIVSNIAMAATGIATSWAVFSWLPSAVVEPLAWGGRRSIGVYLMEGLFVPLLLGAGILGSLLTSLAIIAVTLVMTRAVESVPYVRGLALGRSAPAPLRYRHLE